MKNRFTWSWITKLVENYIGDIFADLSDCLVDYMISSERWTFQLVPKSTDFIRR